MELQLQLTQSHYEKRLSSLSKKVYLDCTFVYKLENLERGEWLVVCERTVYAGMSSHIFNYGSKEDLAYKGELIILNNCSNLNRLVFHSRQP